MKHEELSPAAIIAHNRGEILATGWQQAELCLRPLGGTDIRCIEQGLVPCMSRRPGCMLTHDSPRPRHIAQPAAAPEWQQLTLTVWLSSCTYFCSSKQVSS